MRVGLMTFKNIEEGVDIFQVTKVEDSLEKFGKVKVTFTNANGESQTITYTIMKFNGSKSTVVDGALIAFSIMAKNVLYYNDNYDNEDMEEVEPSDLLGCFVQAEAYLEGYEDKNGNTKKSVKFRNWEPAVGFKGASKPSKKKAPKEESKAVDIDDILGDDEEDED